jgi:hypothetical protein
MTLTTGGGVDTVTVLANSAGLTIDSTASSGGDFITLGGTPDGLSGLGAGVTVHAAATDALLLNDQGFAAARTFTVTDTTVSWGGPTVTYSGLSSLTLQGGTGGNTFDVPATSDTAAVTVQGGGSAGKGDTLVGSNAGNTFTLTGRDTGTLGGSAYGSAVTFNGVGNLTGGSGGDTFVFTDSASLTGNIVGGGQGTLDYSAFSGSVLVDLQTGFATRVVGTVSGIGSVFGGTGNGAQGAYNLLIGDGGNFLVGGLGRRNLLVAGGSASVLAGGDQEDLLIAGSTRYDTEAGLAAWRQVAAEWAGPDDYATRVARLTAGTGVPLLDATTWPATAAATSSSATARWRCSTATAPMPSSALTRTPRRSPSPTADDLGSDNQEISDDLLLP